MTVWTWQKAYRLAARGITAQEDLCQVSGCHSESITHLATGLWVCDTHLTRYWHQQDEERER